MAKRKKKNTVLGLDLGSQSIKAVEVTRKGEELEVTGCSYEPVTDPALYDVALKAAIETGALSTKNVVIGFSGKSTLLQVINLPADRLENIDAAILEEAEKYIPYDISEAQIDYHIFDTSDAVVVKALLVAVRQQDIEDKLEILFGAGIRPNRIDVELVALTNGLEMANAGGYFLGENRTAAMVDFGATKTLIAITDNEHHLYREYPVGGNALTEMISQRLQISIGDAEEVKLEPKDRMDLVKDAIYPGLEDITSEINSCLSQFKSISAGREPDVMLLSGGMVGFPGVTPLIGRLTKTETRIYDSFGAVDASSIDAAIIGDDAHKFSIAFGLACHAVD